MADWRKFQDKMKNKRLKKGKKVEPGTSKAEHETIVVQRLSSRSSGESTKILPYWSKGVCVLRLILWGSDYRKYQRSLC